VKRGRVKTSYRNIIRGTDPELVRALDGAAGGKLTPESIHIRHSLVVLDLEVARLGIRGFIVEDLPSLILNCAVVSRSICAAPTILNHETDNPRSSDTDHRERAKNGQREQDLPERQLRRLHAVLLDAWAEERFGAGGQAVAAEEA
jgi:hypothetical protein